MSFKRILFDLLGLICSLAPPIVCTLEYFPVWKETVGTWSMVGGTSALIAVVAFIILAKYFRQRIKTPSSVVVFLILWLFLTLIEPTVSGLKMVAFWGFFGSIFGTVFFWLSDRTEKKG